MVNASNQTNLQLTWQSIFWRVVVTVLLLLALAGSGLKGFDTVTSSSETQVLPLSSSIEIQ